MAGRRSVTAALIALAVWPAEGARASAAVSPSRAQLGAARAFAHERAGTLSYAVIDSAGRLHSRGGARAYPAASLGKTLLLLATLRRYPHSPLPPAVRRQLDPMIRVSSNRAARVVYRSLGDAPLREVTRTAGLRRVTLNGTWSNLTLTAPDVARLFARLDRVTPRRHRAYAHALLRDVTPQQRWGIPRALERHGWTVELKGGWRRRLVHQGAVARRDGRRVVLAILTDDSPSHEYGRATLEALARRLLTSAR